MLEEKIVIAGRTAQNRVVINPMEGCDCNKDGSPSELTEKKYLTYAKSGAAIIWFEANAVCEEGRTNARQMHLTQENLSAFRALTDKIKTVSLRENGFKPIIALQLTHSGRQSVKPIIAYRNSVYEKTRPLDDSFIAMDEYLRSLPEKFAKSAGLAKAAGFDAVDVKCCHGYLFQELLSAFSRPGAYGGSFENRTRLLCDCFRAVKETVGDSMITASRLGVSDMVAYPNGFGTDSENNVDMSEPIKLVDRLIKEGLNLLNVTVGNPYYNPHVNRPFRKGAYLPPEEAKVGLERFARVEKQLKTAFPNLVIVGSGVSYYRDDLIGQAEKLIEDGACDMVGFGREGLAYPEFYKDYLRGAFDAKRCCVACSRCTELMRNGCVSGCAVFNPYYKKLYEEKVLCKK